MIRISRLCIFRDTTQILQNISLEFEVGKNYLILGKNGSGKTSLAQFLMGNPAYAHESGTVQIDEKNLLDMDVHERAKAGLFLSFQHPPEIPGIGLSEYLHTIYNEHLKHIAPDSKPVTPFVFQRMIKKYLQKLDIPESFLSRDLWVGLSGGEKRKLELLQCQLLQPKYIIFDEIDSWLDVNALGSVAKEIALFSTQKNTLVVITHNFRMSDFIPFDYVYILEKGILKESGDIALLERIKKNGFTYE